jgi:hypothetical protein
LNILGHLNQAIERGGDEFLHWLWRGPGISPDVPLIGLFSSWTAANIVFAYVHGTFWGYAGLVIGFIFNVWLLQRMSRLSLAQLNASILAMRSAGMAWMIRWVILGQSILVILIDLTEKMSQEDYYQIVHLTLYGIYWVLLWSLRPSGPRGKLKMPKLSFSILTPQVAYAPIR